MISIVIHPCTRGSPQHLPERGNKKPDSMAGLSDGAFSLSGLFQNSLVHLLSMHRDLLRCVYPDSCLVASDGQDSYLDVITNADGFAVSSR